MKIYFVMTTDEHGSKVSADFPVASITAPDVPPIDEKAAFSSRENAREYIDMYARTKKDQLIEKYKDYTCTYFGILENYETGKLEVLIDLRIADMEKDTSVDVMHIIDEFYIEEFTVL